MCVLLEQNFRTTPLPCEPCVGKKQKISAFDYLSVPISLNSYVGKISHPDSSFFAEENRGK